MTSHIRYAPYKKPITRRDKKKILAKFMTSTKIIEEHDDPYLGYYIKIDTPKIWNSPSWVHQWYSYNGEEWNIELIESKSTIYRRIKKARKAVMDNEHAFSLDEIEKATAIMESIK